MWGGKFEVVVAFNPMVLLDLYHRGVQVSAFVGCIGASRSKPAASGYLYRAGDISLERLESFSFRRVGNGD